MANTESRLDSLMKQILDHMLDSLKGKKEFNKKTLIKLQALAKEGKLGSQEDVLRILKPTKGNSDENN